MATVIDERRMHGHVRHQAGRDGLSRLSREAASFSTAITGAFKAAVDRRAGLRGRAQGAWRCGSPAIALDAATAADRQRDRRRAGRIRPRRFAGGAAAQRMRQGGVVGGPTLFPLARGSGLPGEAGPEAVLPLARARRPARRAGGGAGADGRARQRHHAGRRQLSEIRGAGDGDARPRRRARAEGTVRCRR